MLIPSSLPKNYPDFFYGTAWKEELTEACVFDALKVGLRAIDTANQRKHYFEEGVGIALAKAYSSLGIGRESLFLQTKFTYARGQDQRKPYDENAPLKIQMRQSLESSLRHLNTDRLDSYLLHGPAVAVGLTDGDWEIWGEMEEACRAGKTNCIGISNVNLEQLAELYENSQIKPTFVQNRCFAEKHWDREIRSYCVQNGIYYQGFSLLTANAKFLGGKMEQLVGRNIPQLLLPENKSQKREVHQAMQNILEQTGKSIAQIVFRFAHQLGMIPLVGTRSPAHMALDLEIRDFSLTEDQLRVLENVAFLSLES